MKIEITEAGVYDDKGNRIEIGEVMTIKGDDLPAAFVNKCRVIGEKPEKAEAVINPVKAD